MPGLPPQLESIQFPLLGNSVAVGVVALLHIALASLAVGFMLLAPLAEFGGRSRPWLVDAARTMTRFTVVTYTASLVLAVIMIDLFIGLFPLTNSHLFNKFRYPVYVATIAFLLQLFSLYPYYHYWDVLRARTPRLHLILGVAAALFMLVWVAVLDGMGSYMLTPVKADDAWSRISNPTWGPLVLHRLFGNLVLAGYVLAGYAAWRLRAAQNEDDGYYLRVLKAGLFIGLTTLMLQPATGFLYARTIGASVPEAYQQLIKGPYQPLVYLQFTLLGTLFVASHLWLRVADAGAVHRWIGIAVCALAVAMVASVGHPGLRRAWTFALVGLSAWALFRARRLFEVVRPGDAARFRAPAVRHLSVAMAIVAVLIYLTMGTIRETARRPDTIRGLISLEQEASTPAAYREWASPTHREPGLSRQPVGD